MANHTKLPVMFRLTAATRRYSTSTAAATLTKKKENYSLFHKLSAIDGGGGATDVSVSDTLDEWLKQGKLLTSFDIIRCVNRLRKFKKYHHALQIYEWMEKSKTKMNNVHCAICIDLFAKTKGVASAEKYFKSLESTAKTTKTYGALLSCYCREKMLDKAVELFDKMKELSFMSALTYNNMMSLYLRIGQPENVPLLAKEMEEMSIAPDMYTYNQLINSHAALKDFNAVDGVLEMMRKMKVMPDWFTYGNLATIYVNEGLIDKANASLQKLENVKNLHDQEAFQTLITLYAQLSNLSKVIQAWESLKSTFAKPSNVSYLIMLLALSKLEDVDGLDKCFAEWESGCSNYDVRLSNVILKSYLSRDMIKEANALHERMVSRGAEPNLTTLDLFTNFYLKKRQMDLAMIFFEKGASKASSGTSNWFPKKETVSVFQKVFEEEKDTESAEKFCQSMKKVGRLDLNAYMSLLRTYVAAGKVELQMRQRVKEDVSEICPEAERLLQEVCPQ